MRLRRSRKRVGSYPVASVRGPADHTNSNIALATSQRKLNREWNDILGLISGNELLAHLRRSRGMRRSRHHTQKTSDHGRIKDTVSISERPAEAEDRAVPGHWEGDLLFGSNNSPIVTLVERQSRYVMLARADGKDTETVINALIEQAQRIAKLPNTS